jgi:hypothetical protein
LRTIYRALLHVARIVGSYLLLAKRFVELYWRYVAAAVGGSALSWLTADAASDYTKGGWEFHIQQRAWGLDLHVHHWYYGLPLLAVAFLLLDTRPILSVFVFVFGQSLAAHSYHNEHGIPSIFQGGETIAVPPFIYWPVASLLVALFTFFVVRAHEWLTLSAEREEAAASYVTDAASAAAALDAIDAWARTEFDRAETATTKRGVRTASYSRLDAETRGIRELLCGATPLDGDRRLLTVRVLRVPLRGDDALLDLLARVDGIVKSVDGIQHTVDSRVSD